MRRSRTTTNQWREKSEKRGHASATAYCTVPVIIDRVRKLLSLICNFTQWY